MRGNAYPIVTLVDDLLCLVPVAVLHGALEVGSMVAVKVLEDPGPGDHACAGPGERPGR
jgi:hypothetical protein